MNVGGYRDTILSASFLIWYVLLTFPILTVVGDVGEGVGPVPLYQVLGAVLFLAAAAVAYRYGRPIGGYDHFQASIIVIIFLSLGLQLHDDEVSIMIGVAYTIALIGTILSLSLISTMPADVIAKCLGRTAIALVAFGILAIAIFGWPEERHLGPVHANAFGSAMLVAFIFSLFGEGALFFCVRIACFILAASVSSRFAMIGCLLALVVFEVTSNAVGLKILVAGLLAAACFVVFNEQVVSILALDDPSRNVSSGFTGRDEHWLSSLRAIENNPLGMGFKRPPLDAWGHNGYLKILVEFGVVGGGLIIAAVVSIVIRALHEAAAGFRKGDRFQRLASARAAGLVVLTFATFFQPQLLNLGDVHGISFMLLLFWRGRASDRRPSLSLRGQIDYGPARAAAPMILAAPVSQMPAGYNPSRHTGFTDRE